MSSTGMRPLAIVAVGLLMAACGGTAATPAPTAVPPAVTAVPPAATVAPPAVTAAPTAAPSPTTQPPMPTLAPPATTSDFHLVKACNGTVCQVKSSSDALIPVNTVVMYSGDGPLKAVITVAGGTATGICDIAVLPGTCKFATGTGTLAQFYLDVTVTKDAAGLWHWDGKVSS